MAGLGRVAAFDEFYLDTDRVSRAGRLEKRPANSDDPIREAYLGAIAEHLCSRWQLGAAPAWVNEEHRFLSRPFFLGAERDKPFLLAESPSDAISLSKVEESRIPEILAKWQVGERRELVFG